jgi:protein SCO1/2
VLDATLVATDGRRVTLSSFKGKVVVVSDFMSLCQESCPLDTANVLSAARAVEKAGLGDKVEFLSVSIDPGRDTVARLAAFRKLYAPAPKDWMVLTSSRSILGPFWNALGVYIKKTADKPPLPRDWWTGKPLHYDITHSDDVFFVDPSGNWRYLFDGIPHVAQGAAIPKTIRSFMDDEGEHNLADPGPAAWTVPQELKVLSWLTKHKIPDASGD